MFITCSAVVLTLFADNKTQQVTCSSKILKCQNEQFFLNWYSENLNWLTNRRCCSLSEQIYNFGDKIVTRNQQIHNSFVWVNKILSCNIELSYPPDITVISLCRYICCKTKDISTFHFSIFKAYGTFCNRYLCKYVIFHILQSRKLLRQGKL